MAYSDYEVMKFHLADHFAQVVATGGINIEADASADVATFIVPLPLLIYAFGVVVNESFAAAAVGSLFLERSTVILGTDTTVVELDYDSTSLRAGDGFEPSATASTGSEDIDAGDVIFYADAATFPILIEAPQVLTVRHVNTTVNGIVEPFIVARWKNIDGRPTSVWTNTN